MRRQLAFIWIALSLLACGSSGSNVDAGTDAGQDAGDPVGTAGAYALTIRAGTYDLGTRRGLALLASIRDSNGRGPTRPFSISVRSPRGELVDSLTYGDTSDGSFMAWWWESFSPESGLYSVTATGESGTISLKFQITDLNGLAPPSLGFSDGGSIVWQTPAGALAHKCSFFSGPTLLMSTPLSLEPKCDLATLGDGGFTVVAQSFSVDLLGLSNDRNQKPALAASFNVSEAQLSFVRGPSGGDVLRASAGALNFGTTAGGLAVWVSIVTTAGTLTTDSWAVAVTGPGLPASSPMKINYAAGLAQKVAWSYDVPAQPGLYTVTATSGAKQLATQVMIGAPARLPIVLGPRVAAGPSGGADVSWMPVPGAISYWVSVWPSGASAAAPEAAGWVRATAMNFATQTFAAGRAYDVYVSATDSDLTTTFAPPGRSSISVSENTYAPVRFTAK